MYKILLGFLTLAFVHLSADTCCNKSTVGIELLLFKPSVDQPSFVVSSTLNAVGDEFFPNGVRHNNSFCYEPGFRVTGLSSLCGFGDFAEDRFTYLTASHTRTISGPFLFDTVGWPGEGAQAPEDTSYAGTARMHNSFVYYGFDATGNSFTMQGLEFFVGLHGAYVQHKTNFTSTGVFGDAEAPVSNVFNEYSSFWGVGPQIGFNYEYGLPCNILLVSSFRGALLCSNTQAHLHYSSLRTVGTEGVNLINETIWRVTPTFDARIGASYNTCCYGFATALEVGYEWIWYHACVNQIKGTDVAFPAASFDLYSNLSLQGPYVRLAVSF